MRVLVVVESAWGNTAAIAEAIADGLRPADVEVVTTDAADAALPADLDLLLVGGPTQGFGMSTPDTRRTARDRGAPRVPERGIREWIDALDSAPRRIRVATFDTRTVTPRLPGSAAKKALKQLVGLGFEPAAKAETFGVHGFEGPLADGELGRATDWGGSLAQVVAAG
ncbi:flavodoxin [Agromyces rhizosphaerae]|uniref:Flavodoxin n=1 Tax=Agromyces rhizosphaerae TaxID=88374 RepID=A0A9W6CQG6_9MICO|nr:flavodoxin domain-containing protein [Agromyces rhizosphaerae]GLI26981.1 flavodoxin [Agromyces rhizosphaerae]